MLLVVFAACRSQQPPLNDNKKVTVSTDIAELGKLLNLKTFPPEKVQFRNTVRDNSGGDDPLAIPGPSDSYLEAILYYNPETFRKLQAALDSSQSASAEYQEKDFEFDWLSQEIKEELSQSDTSYHGHDDPFFSRNSNSRLWLLKGKLLLYSYTD